MTERIEEEAARARTSSTDRAKLLLALAAVMILLSACGITAAQVANRVARDKQAEAALGQDPYFERSRIKSETVLVIGADEELVTGFTIVRADAGTKTLTELTVPADVMIKPPGGAARRLDDLYRTSPALVVSELSSYLQIPIGNWLVVPSSAYKDSLAESDILRAYSSISSSNFPDRSRYDAYRDRLEECAEGGVTRIGFPVRTVDVEGELFAQPHREEIAADLAAVWGVAPEALTAEPTVAVQNGTERKGFAAKVSRGLLAYGFQVSQIGNAPTFTEPTTRIFVRDGFEADATELARRIPLGSVPIEPLEDARAGYDIAVVIGADHPVDIQPE